MFIGYSDYKNNTYTLAKTSLENLGSTVFFLLIFVFILFLQMFIQC